MTDLTKPIEISAFASPPWDTIDIRIYNVEKTHPETALNWSKDYDRLAEQYHRLFSHAPAMLSMLKKLIELADQRTQTLYRIEITSKRFEDMEQLVKEIEGGKNENP